LGTVHDSERRHASSAISSKLQLPPEQFTAGRNQLPKTLRDAGDAGAEPNRSHSHERSKPQDDLIGR